MKKKLTTKITILGSGTSTGVPQPLCRCKVCSSKHPKNKRMRSSIFIETGGKKILVDTTPDLARQSKWITGLDAIIITHCHADHLHGFDDIRSFNFALKNSIPVYTTFEHWLEIKNRFSYLFQGPSVHYKAQIIQNNLLTNCHQKILDQFFYIFYLKHGETFTIGFKQQKWAYLIDFFELTLNDQKKLQNLEILILDCVRFQKHRTHLNLSDALEIVKLLKPQKTYLTHLSHDFDAQETSKMLPENVFLAYDGLKITIEE